MKKIVFFLLAFLLIYSWKEKSSSEKKGEFHSFSHSLMEEILREEKIREVFDLKEEEYQAVFHEAGEEIFL